MDYAAGSHTVLACRRGDHERCIPNLWQDNFLTAAIPYVFAPSIYGAAGRAGCHFKIPFVPLNLPTAYDIQGQPIFATGRTQDVPANTVMDLHAFSERPQRARRRATVQLLNITGIAKNFGNGYIGSWTAGVDHDFGDFKFNASYVATAGIHLARVYNPNSYGGADARRLRRSRNSILRATRSAGSVRRS